MTWDMDEEDLAEGAVERAEAMAADYAAPQTTTGGREFALPVTPSLQQQYQIVTEAQRRLAKAQLYQAILDQPMFGTNSVNPAIVEEVSSELRNFALERLEIMLGMRAPANAPVNTEVALTSEEVSQVRQLLSHTLDGNVPVLGAEESTALRLLLSKITGKAPSLPKALTPTVRPIQVNPSPSIVQSTIQTAAFVQPAVQNPKPAPAPKARRKASDNPAKKAMPTVAMMNQKIAAEAMEAVSSSPASPSLLGLAIQTALKNSKGESE